VLKSVYKSKNVKFAITNCVKNLSVKNANHIVLKILVLKNSKKSSAFRVGISVAVSQKIFPFAPKLKNAWWRTT